MPHPWQMANMNDRTCASARVNNFRYQVRYRAGGQGPLGVGARSICMLANEHGSRVLVCVLTGGNRVPLRLGVDFQTIVAVGRTPLR